MTSMPSAFTTILGPISRRHSEAIASISSGEADKRLVLSFYTEWVNGCLMAADRHPPSQCDGLLLEQLSDSYWANTGMLALIRQTNSTGGRMLSDMRLMDSVASNIVTSGDIIGFDQLIKGEVRIPLGSKSPLNSWRASCDLAAKTYPRMLEHFSTKEDADIPEPLTTHQIADAASWWCG